MFKDAAQELRSQQNADELHKLWDESQKTPIYLTLSWLLMGWLPSNR